MRDSPSWRLGALSRGRVGGNGRLGYAEAGDGFGERGGGAAVRPAGAEGDVDAEAELATFGLGVGDGVEHFGGEEGEIFDVLRGVVELLGVDEGEFGAADAVGLHLGEFAEDFGLGDGGAEPPPADHGLGGVGRVEKLAAKGFYSRGGADLALCGGLGAAGGGGESEEEGCCEEGGGSGWEERGGRFAQDDTVSGVAGGDGVNGGVGCAHGVLLLGGGGGGGGGVVDAVGGWLVGVAEEGGGLRADGAGGEAKRAGGGGWEHELVVADRRITLVHWRECFKTGMLGSRSEWLLWGCS